MSRSGDGKLSKFLNAKEFVLAPKDAAEPERTQQKPSEFLGLFLGNSIWSTKVSKDGLWESPQMPASVAVESSSNFSEISAGDEIYSSARSSILSVPPSLQQQELQSSNLSTIPEALLSPQELKLQAQPQKADEQEDPELIKLRRQREELQKSVASFYKSKAAALTAMRSFLNELKSKPPMDLARIKKRKDQTEDDLRGVENKYKAIISKESEITKQLEKLPQNKEAQKIVKDVSGEVGLMRKHIDEIYATSKSSIAAADAKLGIAQSKQAKEAAAEAAKAEAKRLQMEDDRRLASEQLTRDKALAVELEKRDQQRLAKEKLAAEMSVAQRNFEEKSGIIGRALCMEMYAVSLGVIEAFCNFSKDLGMVNGDKFIEGGRNSEYFGAFLGQIVPLKSALQEAASAASALEKMPIFGSAVKERECELRILQSFEIISRSMNFSECNILLGDENFDIVAAQSCHKLSDALDAYLKFGKKKNLIDPENYQKLSRIICFVRARFSGLEGCVAEVEKVKAARIGFIEQAKTFRLFLLSIDNGEFMKELLSKNERHPFSRICEFGKKLERKDKLLARDWDNVQEHCSHLTERDMIEMGFFYHAVAVQNYLVANSNPRELCDNYELVGSKLEQFVQVDNSLSASDRIRGIRNHMIKVAQLATEIESSRDLISKSAEFFLRQRRDLLVLQAESSAIDDQGIKFIKALEILLTQEKTFFAVARSAVPVQKIKEDIERRRLVLSQPISSSKFDIADIVVDCNFNRIIPDLLRIRSEIIKVFTKANTSKITVRKYIEAFFDNPELSHKILKAEGYLNFLHSYQKLSNIDEFNQIILLPINVALSEAFSVNWQRKSFSQAMLKSCDQNSLNKLMGTAEKWEEIIKINAKDISSQIISEINAILLVSLQCALFHHQSASLNIRDSAAQVLKKDRAPVSVGNSKISSLEELQMVLIKDNSLAAKRLEDLQGMPLKGLQPDKFLEVIPDVAFGKKESVGQRISDLITNKSDFIDTLKSIKPCLEPEARYKIFSDALVLLMKNAADFIREIPKETEIVQRFVEQIANVTIQENLCRDLANKVKPSGEKLDYLRYYNTEYATMNVAIVTFNEVINVASSMEIRKIEEAQIAPEASLSARQVIRVMGGGKEEMLQGNFSAAAAGFDRH